MEKRNGGLEFVFRLESIKWTEVYPYLPDGLLIHADSEDDALDTVRGLLEQIGVENPGGSPARWFDVYILEEVFVLDDTRFCPHAQELTMNPSCSECADEEAMYAARDITNMESFGDMQQDEGWPEQEEQP